MLLPKHAVCDDKKSKFFKGQEASGLLSSLETTTLLSKIPLACPLLFQRYQQVSTRYKMNQRVNKFLLVGDNFMPDMHLR